MVLQQKAGDVREQSFKADLNPARSDAIAAYCEELGVEVVG
jgi:hypothetical protein